VSSHPAPDPPALSSDQISQIAAIVYTLMRDQAPVDPELRLYDAEQSGDLLGKTAWWVKDQARRGLIPCTRVGRSVHMSAAQIREVRARGEVDPATRRRTGRVPKPRTQAA
jgi:hypothetical protein